ncbi:hypothetical protein GCM10023220_33560 [Streptomyces ziwulingensis]|uniref:LamG-like jellyroll fold domain-containing protein n=1 Tax=Streptomyces ziwulingensis TaxID=1045501 RepID=A0ABP9BXF8_9ACTN
MRPSLDRLTTEGSPCDVVTPTPVRVAPTLRAVLSDPDGDPVSAEFEVSRTTEGSESPSGLRFSTGAKTSGSQFSWTVPDTVPDGPVSWRVRAKDADGYGPWSDSAEQGWCRYLKDTQVPPAPGVASPDVPDGGDEWADAVGRHPAFTFTSAAPDVVEYRYTFGAEAARTARPEEPGGPVTVRLSPSSPGVKILEVQARDGAGNLSAPTRYTLRIASPADSVARWKLDDAAGSQAAAEASGGQSAWAGQGVTFGAEGPTGTSVTGAATLGGEYDGWLRAEVEAADPAKTFAVSAWVRPEDVDRGMTAVSQTGFIAPSDYALGTAVGEDGQPSFTFSLPDASGGATRVTGGAPTPGEWAHLMGVYDPVAGSARLYVDGALAASADAAVPDGLPLGYVEIGRELESDGLHWTGNWHGDLADVRVWDRVVLPEEIADLGHRTPQRTGYWAMNTVRTEEGSTGTPDAWGQQSLLLYGDAHLDTTDPLAGEGSISLDGDGDHLDSDGHQVDTARSYTVTARVRLHQWAPEQDMALFAQGGDEADAFTLRYRGSGAGWEAVFAHGDTSDAATTTLTAPYGDGAHTFAVQYDDKAGEVRLFQDGVRTDSAPYAAADAWDAYRALQVGRDGAGRGGDHHLDGDVDEVRTYAGVLSATEIRTLAGPEEHPDL